MNANKKIMAAFFSGILILFFSFVLLNSSGLAQKTGEKTKKKLYISKFKESGVSDKITKQIKEGIRLAIFGNYGSQYQVVDDYAIKVMYKQAEAYISSGCNDKSCMTKIADIVKASEIIYGEAGMDSGKITVSATCLERAGVAFVTKSIVKLSFLESQLDYAVTEIGKKLIQPWYKTDMSKAPAAPGEIRLGGVEIKAVAGLDIAVLQFTTNDETAARIIGIFKPKMESGDADFNSGKHSVARETYNDILSRIDEKLRPDSKAKIVQYTEGIHKRVEATWRMEFKTQTDGIDIWLKGIREPSERDYEEALKKYYSLLSGIAAVPQRYAGACGQVKVAVIERKDNLLNALLAGIEKRGDLAYREYRFTDAIDDYGTAKERGGKITDEGKKWLIMKRIDQKIQTATVTSRSWLENSVKSYADMAEVFNLEDKTSDALSSMDMARNMIMSQKSMLVTDSVLSIYNSYTGQLKIDKITRDMLDGKKPPRKEDRGIVESKSFHGIEMVRRTGGKTPSFWIGKYEVTQKQYEDVMGTNPSQFKGKPDNPVENVSWYNAVEFCNKLSKKTGLKPYYTIDKNKNDPKNKNSNDNIKWTVTINEGANGFRLPTSEEWEYACRAGTTTTYYWGNTTDFAIVDQYAIYQGKSFNKVESSPEYGTRRVGSKRPNAWGLYDMSGNVFEWCFDWYGGGERGSYRVYMGGSWNANADFLKSGEVVYYSPNLESFSLGFRLAKNE